MNNIEHLRQIYGSEMPVTSVATRILLMNAITDIQRLCDELEEKREEVVKLRSRYQMGRAH